MTLVLPIGPRAPRVAATAWLAPSATVAGDVTLGDDVGVFYGAVLRGDSDAITIGARTNLQDGVVVHVDAGHPTLVGTDVTVGHRAVLHGCTVEDGCLIGMSATVMNDAVIGAGSLVAAGALVVAGTEVPPGSLVAGVPAKVRREVTDDERRYLTANAAHYVELAREHRAALAALDADAGRGGS
ncbi:conserved hypothetical protein [Beutenbergia cavernae DSM 12333]|uniref:Gamma carbonic anhydrase family protein n=1 Tax=Beutenbergia cavernae (strain ATCC BAA-8 / DSM 12333 / CCUG 43141 / JCM 11478 / NBRC 16432 / NCIMB 13614 / HKI 0122) TaxID=471853 RepID=C5C054_BEUC1|nr:gamma carbonic anhydrase family protein [Beutenbergia cavernae]ACQ79240.1 conserved hypothetical protein [Beutenbergia cavernae DSM 12333]